jgi:hypothetical protein
MLPHMEAPLKFAKLTARHDVEQARQIYIAIEHIVSIEEVDGECSIRLTGHGTPLQVRENLLEVATALKDASPLPLPPEEDRHFIRRKFEPPV